MATGPHIVQPSSLGPVIHRDSASAPAALTGPDAFDPPDEATFFGVPIVVVFVMVVLLPEVVFEIETFFDPVIVVVVTVFVGADVTTAPPLRLRPRSGAGRG